MAARKKSRVDPVVAEVSAPMLPPEEPEHADLDEEDADAPVVGESLRRLRTERGWSLEKLAQTAGVSRAMLGQIELGQSTPTIKTLWKISRALDVPFSALLSGKQTSGTMLLRASQTRRLTNERGTFVSRALFPLGGPRRVEFYELKLAIGAEEQAVAHSPGTVETLAINRGEMEVEVRGQTHVLKEGDVLVFEADVPHVYRNVAAVESIGYLVMTYETTRV